ncbi:2Fe-2S iron-sulfur cluster-binding protein [Beggiatoa leptomitoformis]|uniref:2Fe-2S iron-sulfur cluster binding domain-containing protein n=1 Tax=Beggiatoa leptomitoformis TaxID=288004 RepID=A0A2N9YDR6_9GAMM|nr:2Fe-2S iron-sulfur cluster-binding protein [Beggiatoa leptomitoformis]ALG68991.1 2Fe-2S iron-sulfur cluster binding domain-containing protein [Beggiatoa leptomitoformis]AUI68614.1 2Fe-2S iron-sulfur cluster binding domain-containing protein [Beggiatoa leptomitoformis]
MANITFSNPSYRDKTVYAVAGSHTETILSIAREYKVPIEFNCGDGECGTCVIKVTSLDEKGRMSSFLTDKEKLVLKQVGKLTAEDIEKAGVSDIPPQWRLACQFIVRDEDILVEY